MAKISIFKKSILTSMYANTQLFALSIGIRACYDYDNEVKKLVEEMSDGYSMGIGMFNSDKKLIITKTDGKLSCKVESLTDVNNCTVMYFKSLKLAMPILRKRATFFNAYAENSIMVSGDTHMGAIVIRILDIVQIYLSSNYTRKKYLHQKQRDQKISRKVRTSVVFRGWL